MVVSADAKWNDLLLPVFCRGRSIIGGVGSLVSLLVHVTVQLQVSSELFTMEPYVLAIMNFILSVRLLI